MSPPAVAAPSEQAEKQAILNVIGRMEAAWKRLQWPMVWLAVRRRVRGVLPSR